MMNRIGQMRLAAGWLVTAYILIGCAHLEPQARQATALAEAHMQASGLPGLAVSVAIDGDIVWSEGFGYADMELRVPVDPTTTNFRVGSTAKSMTAMAVGQLLEAGRLDLDAPIQSYLPQFPEKEAPITARQLAGHLAGIRHYQDDEFYSSKAYASVQEGLAIFADDPLVAAPGTEFNYSTYGFNLLSAVVEQASGEEFLSYMTSRVFAPVGMRHTVPDRPVPLIDGRSAYYREDEGRLVNAPWVDNSNKWAGGRFLSTSEDLVRFGSAHLTNDFLKPETIAMMWTPQTTSDGKSTGYGIGWSVDTDANGHNYIGHTGGSVGGTTVLRIYRDRGVVIALISNMSSASLGDLADSIADVFLRK